MQKWILPYAIPFFKYSLHHPLLYRLDDIFCG